MFQVKLVYIFYSLEYSESVIVSSHGLWPESSQCLLCLIHEMSFLYKVNMITILVFIHLWIFYVF